MKNKNYRERLRDWDWKKNDNKFFNDFINLPESKSKRYYESMKELRYNRSRKKINLNFSPKILFRKLGYDSIFIIFGLAYALYLPFYWNKLAKEKRIPDDEYIDKIKNKSI